MRSNTKTVTVKITDNVLDDAEHTVYLLWLSPEGIVRQKLIWDGVYRVDLVGMSISLFGEWLEYDPTGEHPEVWHELFNPYTEKYEPGTIELLDKILTMNIRYE